MNTDPDHPLISCLCVTENRVAFLNKSIQCFLSQTYPNRELIVVFPETDTATVDYLQSCDPRIVPLPLENSALLTLGAKRNIAIQKSRGNFFCVWDDDDWHHPQRLIIQYQALTNSQARSCVLSRILLYDGVTRKSFISGKRQAWEGTLLCERSVSQSFAYADLQKGEDSVLLYTLLKANLVVAIDNPELYIYVHHGDNTWHRDHWEQNIIRWATALPDDWSMVVEKVMLDSITISASSLLKDLPF